MPEFDPIQGSMIVCALVVLTVLLTILSGKVRCAESARWVGNTSGPIYTGTADLEPRGSWYYEPYFFETLPQHRSTTSLLMPQKIAVGLGHHLEFDAIMPMQFNTAPSVRYFGYSDSQLTLKWQYARERDRYTFTGFPSQALFFSLTIPTGKYDHLRRSRKGADQTGNGTWGEAFGYLLRKQAKPFVFYLQVMDTIFNPVRVHGGYTFNNNLSAVPHGQSLNMIDGNQLSYSGAIEYLPYPALGLGGVLEFYGLWQSNRNLVFGHATAPSWSALWLVPTLEIAWPQLRDFAVTWGAGVALPIAERNYPSEFIPLATVTMYFNFGGAR